MSYSYHKPFTGITAHIFYITATLALGFYTGATYYYFAPGYQSVTKAIATIHPFGPNTVTGKVTFEQQSDGVHIVADVRNLTPGKHGLHIHEYGDGSSSDGMRTGNHFNPTNKQHGGRDNAKRHIGDFGNLEVGQDGTAHVEFVDKDLKLNGPHSIIGRALVIHIGEDDLTTQPAGNAGARVGYGVIGITKK